MAESFGRVVGGVVGEVGAYDVLQLLPGRNLVLELAHDLLVLVAQQDDLVPDRVDRVHHAPGIENEVACGFPVLGTIFFF